MGIGKRSSATNTLFPMPSCRYLLKVFYWYLPTSRYLLEALVTFSQLKSISMMKGGKTIIGCILCSQKNCHPQSFLSLIKKQKTFSPFQCGTVFEASAVLAREGRSKIKIENVEKRRWLVSDICSFKLYHFSRSDQVFRSYGSVSTKEEEVALAPVMERVSSL